MSGRIRGEMAVKIWGKGVLSDKFIAVMWCMKKEFYGNDINKKNSCKFRAKALDRAGFTGYNEQACKGNVNFFARIYMNSNRKAP